MAATPLMPSDPRRVGPFRVTHRLGVGGMGEVFLAVGSGGQRIAVKLVRRELLYDETVRRRFAREVRLSETVGGRYTAKLIRADVDAPQPWLATEFIDGPTLNEYLREHGPLGGGSLRALAIALLEAVAAIHDAGIIHRDLTPNNVLLAPDGPRVVDFGIAHPRRSVHGHHTDGEHRRLDSGSDWRQRRGDATGEPCVPRPSSLRSSTPCSPAWQS